MPLGIERINARRKQPNDRITFIKPLEGPDQALAEDFLERIAAICNPIMKEHHLSVMSLEEYEPNLEFVGRNFNAGEVIQLVLKATYTGHWLPFQYVQMVMMHELAHCKQMNHSGTFWKVRNAYAGELKTLWSRGYTGEGMWSRGITLMSGQYERDGLDAGDVMPEHLCGGTFKSSSKRKRKPKEKTTCKEREARRVARKFGVNGLALGADEETKFKLEKGKKTAAKPRVAGSARGRELRAAAALARFETKKETLDDTHDDNEEDVGGETEKEDVGGETESEDDGDVPAVDINGNKMLDKHGRGMVKVCEDEDKSDVNAANEMFELRSFDMKQWATPSKAPYSLPKESTLASTSSPALNSSQDVPIIISAGQPTVSDKKLPNSPPPAPSTITITTSTATARAVPTIAPLLPLPQGTHTKLPAAAAALACPICSMENDPLAPTCVVCANVLDPARVLSIWRCQSKTCKDGNYVNAGDCGVCGVCGGVR